MRKKLFIIAVFLSGALVGCSSSPAPSAREGGSQTASPQTAPARPVAVEVFEVRPSQNSNELLIPASVSVEGTAVVMAQRDGTIIQLTGQEGRRVARGEIIARLDDDEQRAQFRQAELEVSRLRVEEQQYESLVRVNRNELERERALNRDGISSQSDLERAQFRLDAATRQHEQTRIGTQVAQARVEAARIEADKSIVRAPVAGIITHAHVNLGTSVARNERLFEIGQLAPLIVRFQVPQTEAVRLAPGSLIHLSLTDNTHIIAQARVRRSDPVADAASNTFGYLADLTGGARLMPGTAVNVRLRRANGASVWVPRTAFPMNAELRGGATVTLLVVEGDRCADRVVGLNTIDGDQVEITSGLTAGDRVILAPPVELRVGDAVEVSGS